MPRRRFAQNLLLFSPLNPSRIARFFQTPYKRTNQRRAVWREQTKLLNMNWLTTLKQQKSLIACWNLFAQFQRAHQTFTALEKEELYMLRKLTVLTREIIKCLSLIIVSLYITKNYLQQNVSFFCLLFSWNDLTLLITYLIEQVWKGG